MEDVKLESLIINGKDHGEPIETDIGIFYIRPLTIGEKTTLKAMPLKSLGAVSTQTDGKGGVPKDINVSVNVAAMQEAQTEQRILTLAYGLSCRGKTFTPDKIKQWTVSEKILDILYEKILEISEVSIKSLQPFSTIIGGVGDSVSDRERIQADGQGE